MTFVLGLTGGIATGKSTADAFFKKKKIPVIDADKIAHSIYDVGKPAWQQIKSEFGTDVLNADQTVNRQKLGALVFADQDKLQRLNEITHPLINQEITKQINQEIKKKTSLLVFDAPVLFESHNEKRCDRVLVITLPQDLQVKRLMERNHLTEKDALTRINSQMPLSEKVARADYVLDNTGTIKELENKLEQVLLKIEAEV